MKTKFAVITDLHTEFIHDAPERLSVFLREAERTGCDFCVDLGDFSPPGDIHKDQKLAISELLREFTIPFYHLIGNHDVDDHKKEKVTGHLGLERGYYSFDTLGVHFAVLDACCFFDKGRAYDYDNGNYRAIKGAMPCIPKEQLAWLSADLESTKYPTVLFSHQSLIESRSSISNANELRSVLKKAPHGVILAVCGHEHVDRLEKKDGIYYYCLNSASYYWAGSAYRHTTYGKELERKYQHLQSIFPYREPLFAIIEIDDNEIVIRGRESEFVGATPEAMAFKKPGLCDKITAGVKNRVLPLV